MKYLNPNGNARLDAIMSASSLTLPLQSPRQSDRAASPGGISFDSMISGPHKGAIALSSTESAFFRALLEFLYTASTENIQVFSFLFEDSAFALSKEDSVDRLAEVI